MASPSGEIRDDETRDEGYISCEGVERSVHYLMVGICSMLFILLTLLGIMTSRNFVPVEESESNIPAAEQPVDDQPDEAPIDIGITPSPQ